MGRIGALRVEAKHACPPRTLRLLAVGFSSIRSQPAITCVIPTFRRPGLLARAIRSVLDQSFTNFNICVDNASGDETKRMVEAFAAHDPRVYYHCHRQNIGAQENFIYGLSRAETPFVHLTSDDDFLLPGFYKRAMEGLDARDGAAFFSGGMLSVRPDGQVRTFLRYGVEADQIRRPPAFFILLPAIRKRGLAYSFGALRSNGSAD